jgi:hypothetical protein
MRTKKKDKLEIIGLARLNELFEYCPESGVLFRRDSYSRQFPHGKQAGGISNGYWHVHVDGYKMLVHRVAFYMYYERLPIGGQIDHIDGGTLNNEISNLREVSNLENSKNSRRRIDNSSGVTGVYWHKQTRKHLARISHNGKNISLGSFDDFNEAVAARKAAEVKYGYHKNHGRTNEWSKENERSKVYLENIAKILKDLPETPKDLPKKKRSFKLTQEEALERLSSVDPSIDLRALVYAGTLGKVNVSCKVCGCEWRPIFNNLAKGSGCPECAKSRRRKTNARTSPGNCKDALLADRFLNSSNPA